MRWRKKVADRRFDGFWSPMKPEPRNAFIDHLRVFLTVLVIFHHAAIVYGGSGGWYWRQEPDGSSQWLLLFNAVNQSFFMGLFFLLAGYYTPKSFDRKGAGRFLMDRFMRLGVPWLFYYFIVSPMTIALAKTAEGHPFWSSWWLMIQLGTFEPGPLWFAEALLIFALIYVVGRRFHLWVAPDLARLPGCTTVAVAAVGVGLVSFVLRLLIPVGHTVAWLQLGYFPGYIILFVAGCCSARAQLFERVTWADTRLWAGVSVCMAALLPIVISTRGDRGSFAGGWTMNAAFYALWDPLIAWGIILTLFWFFRARGSSETGWSGALARRAFTAYVAHPPVLVVVSLLARHWAMPPTLKFAVVGMFGSCGAFAAASFLLRIPGLRRVL